VVPPGRHVRRPATPGHDVVEVSVDCGLSVVISIGEIAGDEHERRPVGCDLLLSRADGAVIAGGPDVGFDVEPERAYGRSRRPTSPFRRHSDTSPRASTRSLWLARTAPSKRSVVVGWRALTTDPYRRVRPYRSRRGVPSSRTSPPWGPRRCSAARLSHLRRRCLTSFGPARAAPTAVRLKSRRTRQQGRSLCERMPVPGPGEGHVPGLPRRRPLGEHVTLLGSGRPAPGGVLEGLHDAPVREPGSVGGLDDRPDPREVAGFPLVARVRVERERSAPTHLGIWLDARATGVRVHDHDRGLPGLNA
jgi:hypothetical protein